MSNRSGITIRAPLPSIRKKFRFVALLFMLATLLLTTAHTPAMATPQTQLDSWHPTYFLGGAFVITLLCGLFLLFYRLKHGSQVRTKELQQSQKSLRQVLDLVPNMVYAKNSEGRFLMVNRAMADTLGYEVKEVTGRLQSEIHSDAGQLEQMLQDDQEVIETGLPKLVLEQEFVDRKGQQRWLQTTKLPYISIETEEPAVLGLSVDITERKKANEALRKNEEELKRLNEELENRVEERTRNLEEAKLALEESLETLKRTQRELVMSEKLAALGGLVAGVAHEINTPLGIGVTASSFLVECMDELQQKYDNNDLKRSDLEKYIDIGRDSASNILGNLNRAAELIRSFKQVAADQSSELAREFNLHTYVDEVLLSLLPKYKRVGVDIVNTCADVNIVSYPGAFMQIITNLLINSLTHAYTQEGTGTITISGKFSNDDLLFTFSDDGAGIAADHVDQIFEPFYTTKRNEGGTGLGLHIVHNIVHQTLNGTISCDSTLGHGTVFTVSIPISTSSNQKSDL